MSHEPAEKREEEKQTPVESSIRRKLTDTFHPEHLEVVNESHKHGVPRGSESHFKVVVVSGSFQGVKLIDRHRLVNEVLAEELESGVHALSIKAKTPSQWAKNSNVQKTPPCLGGNGL